MIDIVYAAVRGRIKDEVAAVKWIDLDSGQLDNPSDNYPFPFPAVFIDFPEIAWDDAGERLQDGTVQMNVRVAMRIYDQTHGNTQDNEYDTFSRAMNSLKLLNTIQAKLQGFSDGLTFNRFSRVSTTNERREDGLKVFNVIYSCRLRDKSAMKRYEITEPDTITIRQAINKSHLRLTAEVDDSSPVVDDQVVFTFEIENTGIEAGTEASVYIQSTAGLQYVSDDGATTPQGSGRVWAAGTVNAGATKTLHLTMLVATSGLKKSEGSLTYAEQADPPSHDAVSVELIASEPPAD